jgi:hypothetical protein
MVPIGTAVIIAASTVNGSALFIKCGLLLLGLGLCLGLCLDLLARFAQRFGISPVPLDLLVGLAFGGVAWWGPGQ